ncbi:MAG: SecD/SecF family protein translocase subunit [Oscillospiraceae bacterium]|nr:SecD/SecF family protein translocase subunit [Oscillospiraceae bacterium]
MIKTKKPVFFIVFAIILAFSYSVFFGIEYWYGDLSTVHVKGADQIRLGIDIQGGVDVTFKPVGAAIYDENNNVTGYEEISDVTEEQLDSAMEVIKVRMQANSIYDYESYVDYDNERIIVRFPWQSNEENFDPEKAVDELGETAMVEFCKGSTYSQDAVVLKGEHIVGAKAGTIQNEKTGEPENIVVLEFNEEGKQIFADVTAEQAQTGGAIAICMDGEVISAPTVEESIKNGEATITSESFKNDFAAAKALADKINAGSLPFSLERESFSTISPSMGEGALKVMVISGIIAFILIFIFMIALYRLPGFVASVALLGQIAGTMAAISGFFGFRDSSTLTIPGIAGIILAIGMGVDCQVITFERIKEELSKGKTLDSALISGYQRAFTAILDGNVTIIIVSAVLMGAFGVPGSFFHTIFSPIFQIFGTSTEGTIYSFGQTLFVGVICNFIFGILATKLMLFSLSRFKKLRNKKLYGGVNNE